MNEFIKFWWLALIGLTLYLSYAVYISFVAPEKSIISKHKLNNQKSGVLLGIILLLGLIFPQFYLVKIESSIEREILKIIYFICRKNILLKSTFYLFIQTCTCPIKRSSFTNYLTVRYQKCSFGLFKSNRIVTSRKFKIN